jgi:hypothetical protein
MRAALTTILIASILASTVPAKAQEPPGPPPRTEQRALARGERVDVELRNGRHVAGAVGDRFNGGLTVEQPGPIFVRYRDILAIRDSDTGAIIVVPRPRGPDWTKRILVGMAIVGALALLTHGAFPLCITGGCR